MIAPQFALKQKKQKIQDSRQASYAPGLCPAKTAEPGLETFTPSLRRFPAVERL